MMTSMAITKKRMTLEMLATRMDERFEKIETAMERRFEKLETTIERGFAATADDIAEMATKEQMIALHMQANSIETQLREMNHGRLEVRVGNLEEKVFGEVQG